MIVKKSPFTVDFPSYKPGKPPFTDILGFPSHVWFPSPHFWRKPFALHPPPDDAGSLARAPVVDWPSAAQKKWWTVVPGDYRWYDDDMMIVNTYFRVSSVKVSAGFYLFLGCYIIYIYNHLRFLESLTFDFEWSVPMQAWLVDIDSLCVAGGTDWICHIQWRGAVVYRRGRCGFVQTVDRHIRIQCGYMIKFQAVDLSKWMVICHIKNREYNCRFPPIFRRTRVVLSQTFASQVACANWVFSAKSTCVHPERKDPYLCPKPSSSCQNWIELGNIYRIYRIYRKTMESG